MNAYPPSTPPAPPQRDRTKLWAALVFLLLTVACLVAVAIAFSGGRLPDLGRAEVSWTPPPDQLTVLTGPAPLAAGQPFAPGDSVLNVNPGPVNLRQSPGFQNKPANDVITAVPAGQLGVIAGGPEEVDGLVWWQVRFGESEGWMAERSSSGVTLLDRAP
ncbi:MAG TPA: hypothetical protein VL334_06835 [Anaerolineae bacterium]|nr:hypothetical protein [Anaerolineae bacterium]